MRSRIALRLVVVTVVLLVIASAAVALAVNREVSAEQKAAPAVATSDAAWSAHLWKRSDDDPIPPCAFFLDSVEGWAGWNKGLINHTTDGGLTWTKSYLPDRTLRVEKIQFVSKRRGWVLARGSYMVGKYDSKDSRMYRTTDGGVTWKRLWIRRSSLIEDFQFVDADRGWFVTMKDVFTTNNGGAKLTSQHADKKIPSLGSAHLTSLRFVDAKRGWVAGGYLGGKTTPIMLRTSNGGRTWKLAKSGLSGSIEEVWFTKTATGTTGYALGKGLYKTTNAGSRWSRVKYSSSEWYDSIQAFGASDVRMLGSADRIWTSRDAGKTWKSTKLKVNGRTVTELGPMSFVDADTGWVFGYVMPVYEPVYEDMRFYVLRTPAATETVAPAGRIGE